VTPPFIEGATILSDEDVLRYLTRQVEASNKAHTGALAFEVGAIARMRADAEALGELADMLEGLGKDEAMRAAGERIAKAIDADMGIDPDAEWLR
jgi:hypothetical protein